MIMTTFNTYSIWGRWVRTSPTKRQTLFITFCAFIFGATGLAKLVMVASHQLNTTVMDSVLTSISHYSLVLSAIFFELSACTVLALKVDFRLKCLVVALLSSVFLSYHCTALINSNTSVCSCLGIVSTQVLVNRIQSFAAAGLSLLMLFISTLYLHSMKKSPS